MTAAAVQQMVRGGVELLVGATFDPTFGPLIACGSGGVLVDLVRDTTFRLHPLTDIDATELLDSLKGAALCYAGIVGGRRSITVRRSMRCCTSQRCSRSVQKFTSSTSIHSKSWNRASALWMCACRSATSHLWP